MTKFVCGEGHFTATGQQCCPVCFEAGVYNSIYPNDTHTRALLPGVFGVAEANRCADLYSQGIDDPSQGAA